MTYSHATSNTLQALILAAEHGAPARIVSAATLEQTATGPISLPVGAGWATANTTAGKRAAWVEAPVASVDPWDLAASA